MPDLTNEDRAAIAAAWVTVAWGNAGARSIQDAAEATYRAGLAAGRARAIEECAKVCEATEVAGVKIIGKTEHYPGEYASEVDIGYAGACDDCAAEIRALVK